VLPLAQVIPLAGLAALASGLAAVDRKGALQLMLSRPIVLAPALGALLGDARGGLMLGVPLELLFLGGVNLGGSIPDNEALLAGALTSMVVPAGLLGRGVDASLAALGLALLMPLSVVGRSLDRASERRNAQLAAQATERAAAGDAHAARVNLLGLALPFGATAAICAGCVLASPLLARLHAALPARLVSGFGAGWHCVWALAAASAIRAIRDSRGPLLAAVSAAAAVAVFLLVRGMPW
jgi:mannose/fructose/N-acetylgalactosamine-specific phosphotransferase system component IIC